jgi:hypothetical protein
LRELAPFGCSRRIEPRRTARPRRTNRRASGLPVVALASSVLVGGRVTFGVPSAPRTPWDDDEAVVESIVLVVESTELVVEAIVLVLDATELVVESTELVVLVVDDALETLDSLLVELDWLDSLDWLLVELDWLDSLLVVDVSFGFAQKTAELTSGGLLPPLSGAASPVSDVTAGE